METSSAAPSTPPADISRCLMILATLADGCGPAGGISARREAPALVRAPVRDCGFAAGLYRLFEPLVALDADGPVRPPPDPEIAAAAAVQAVANTRMSVMALEENLSTTVYFLQLNNG